MKHGNRSGGCPRTDQKDQNGLGRLEWESDHAQMNWSDLCRDLDRSGDLK